MERRTWTKFIYGELKRIHRIDQVHQIFSHYHAFSNKAKLLSIAIPAKYRSKQIISTHLSSNEDLSLRKIALIEDFNPIPEEHSTLDSQRRLTFDNSWNKAKKMSDNIHALNPTNKLTKTRSSSKGMVIMVQNYTDDKVYNSFKMDKSKHFLIFKVTFIILMISQKLTFVENKFKNEKRPSVSNLLKTSKIRSTNQSKWGIAKKMLPEISNNLLVSEVKCNNMPKISYLKYNQRLIKQRINNDMILFKASMNISLIFFRTACSKARAEHKAREIKFYWS